MDFEELQRKWEAIEKYAAELIAENERLMSENEALRARIQVLEAEKAAHSSFVSPLNVAKTASGTPTGGPFDVNEDSMVSDLSSSGQTPGEKLASMWLNIRS